MSSQRKYPDNSIDAFRMGANFDMRVRLAMELLKTSPMFSPTWAAVKIAGEAWSKTAAREALDVATELLSLAEERGLVERLGTPEDEVRLEEHAKRSAAFNFAGQKEGQRLAQDASAGRVAVRSALNG